MNDRTHFVLIDPKGEASVPYRMDEGLPFGLGFFETILIRDRAFFLQEHLERLNQSLRHFGINAPISCELVQALIQEHNLQQLALKLMVTEKNRFALVRPIPYGVSDYQNGKKVTISKVVKSKHSPLVCHKSLNYGENMLELRRAKKAQYDDCLFLNEEGHLTESSVANLFLLQDEQLMTAPCSDGLLPGVIRNIVMEQFPVCEKHLTVEDLMSCQAAFLTNSLYGAMHIAQVDNVKKSGKHHLIRKVMQCLGDMLPSEV